MYGNKARIRQESLSLEWIFAERTVSTHRIPAQIADNKKKGMHLTMKLLKKSKCGFTKGVQ
jgi:hypothetical protein